MSLVPFLLVIKKYFISLTLFAYFKQSCPLALSFKGENILSYLSTEFESFTSFGVLHRHVDPMQEINLFYCLHK